MLQIIGAGPAIFRSKQEVDQNSVQPVISCQQVKTGNNYKPSYGLTINTFSRFAPHKEEITFLRKIGNYIPLHLQQHMRYLCCLFILMLFACLANAQKTSDEKKEMRWIRHEITTLSSPNMKGRGYTCKGHAKAAEYIERRFGEMGLKALPTGYTQTYGFPVNTFPDEMLLKIGKKELVPGADYIIDVASSSFKAERKKIHRIDLDKIKDSTGWTKKKTQFYADDVYYLKNVDSFCRRMNIRSRYFAKSLPKACYIIPQHGKLTWDVATATMPATAFYVEDTVLPRFRRKADVNVHSVLLSETKNINENVMAYVPGTVADSYVVFTAHYDHLGTMGRQAIFPGASDNASGTAMLLYLAQYFAAHPQHYSMLFIAFSGEEAGLLGSDYFVKHPPVPLEKMRFLTNLDIMGDATNGVTVVNATEYPNEFKLLQNLNAEGKYIPEIKSRGKAANSDHYHFTEAGVPSFFIYTNGGKGYYHDIFDKANTLSLSNIAALSELLRDFAVHLNSGG